MNRVIKSMMIALVSLTVIGVIALIVVLNLDGNKTAEGKRNIDDIVEASIETEEITTDLKNDRFVRIQFRIITDSDDAKKELLKRDFQLNNILIKELGKMDSEAFKTDIATLEETIKLKLNKIMTEGKITEVYTVKKVLQ
ncbi:flagellar basal body-associated protein FliL [Thalassobacillus hwangdonensis]|uniref:Flagellar protein FliL n=1 Tax=Thalassobacillus hwangdonensis TaxID=546108 RepID=A0ABW3KZ01_9BACI